jgi:spermidine synthase
LNKPYLFSLSFAAGALLIASARKLSFVLPYEDLSLALLLFLTALGFLCGYYPGGTISKRGLAFLFFAASAAPLALASLPSFIADGYLGLLTVLFFSAIVGKLFRLHIFSGSDAEAVLWGIALAFLASLFLLPKPGLDTLLIFASIALASSGAYLLYSGRYEDVKFERASFSAEAMSAFLVAMLFSTFAFSYSRAAAWLIGYTGITFLSAGVAFFIAIAAGYFLAARRLGSLSITVALSVLPAALFVSLLALPYLSSAFSGGSVLRLLPLFLLSSLPAGVAFGILTCSIPERIPGSRFVVISIALPFGLLLDLLLASFLGTKTELFFIPLAALSLAFFTAFKRAALGSRSVVTFLALSLLAGGGAGIVASDAFAQPPQLAYQHESMGELLQVFREDGVTSLKINGYEAASDREAQREAEAFAGYAAMFLHGGEAEKVLMLGIGGGFALRAVEYFDVEEIHAVTSAAQAEAVAAFFSAKNELALEDERLSFRKGSALTYLLRTPESYDVIISLPPPPWNSNNPAYTREFYLLAAQHLKQEGVFVTRLRNLEYGEEEFKVAIRTFMDIFPHSSMWYADGDVILVGSEAPMNINYTHIRKVIVNSPAKPGYRTLFKGATYTDSNLVDEFLSNLLMSASELYDYSYEAEVNTISSPVLEFSTVRNLYVKPNKTLVGNVLLYKLSRQGNPLIYPALEGLYSRDGYNIRLHFLSLEASFDEDWSEDFVGYVFRYRPLATPKGVKYLKSYTKRATFVRGNESLRFYAFESRAYSLSRGMATREEIQQEVRQILEDRLSLLNQRKTKESVVLVGEEEGILMHGAREASQEKSILLGWFCRENKEIYVVSYEYSGKEKQVIPASIACVH